MASMLQIKPRHEVRTCSRNASYTSCGGTMFATFRTTNASPGWNPRMDEGQTLESAQAITINCN